MSQLHSNFFIVIDKFKIFRIGDFASYSHTLILFYFHFANLLRD